MRTVPPLELTAGERAELERRVRAHTSPQCTVRRARIVLLAADGLPSRRIATEVGMGEHHVGRWRRRFAQQRLAGLKDTPRPGRPPVYGHDERLRLVAKVTTQPPDPASHWSHSQLARALAEEDGIGISASQVGRILAKLDLKPYLVRGWITRRDDPQFWERAAEVCGLYLHAPDNAVVLSVDEKTAIGARSRTMATRPLRPGSPAQQEHEYVRHGVANLVAALDVHHGGVLHATDVESNNSVNFQRFLTQVDAKVPPDLAIHLVLDNGSSHIAKATKLWLAEHPRFQATTRPTTPVGSTRSSCSSPS